MFELLKDIINRLTCVIRGHDWKTAEGNDELAKLLKKRGIKVRWCVRCGKSGGVKI